MKVNYYKFAKKNWVWIIVLAFVSIMFLFYFYAPLFKSATVIEGNEEDDDEYDGSDAAGAGTIQSSTESQPQGVATKTNQKQKMQDLQKRKTIKSHIKR